MDSTITLFEILTLAGALVGVYFKLQTEIGKLKARIAMLEKQELHAGHEYAGEACCFRR